MSVSVRRLPHHFPHSLGLHREAIPYYLTIPKAHVFLLFQPDTYVCINDIHNIFRSTTLIAMILLHYLTSTTLSFGCFSKKTPTPFITFSRLASHKPISYHLTIPKAPRFLFFQPDIHHFFPYYHLDSHDLNTTSFNLYYVFLELCR